MKTQAGPSARMPIVLAIAALGVVLAGCAFPSRGCRSEELVAPSNLHPADNQVIDGLSPTLTWSYEGDCEPEGFRISLSSSLEGPGRGLTAEVGGDTTYWVPPSALQPATSYDWTVWAFSGSAEGPRGGGTLGGGMFRTGPVCTSTNPADYDAPTLLNPANGAALELGYFVLSDGTRIPGVYFMFMWDDTTSCLPPEGYHLQAASSPDFAPEAIIEDIITTRNRSHFMFPPGAEWEECADFFWRVSAILPDSTDGPTSETWSFITPSPSGLACAIGLHPYFPPVEVAHPAAGSSAIAGHVWHDECAVPYATSDVVPPGCVRMPDGGLEANGVLDSGEIGIGEVTVHLGSGPCPVADGQTDVTDENGYYSFSLLPAGTYCVAIDAMDEDNISVLIPGNWTSPERWYGPGPIETELSLGEADIQRLNDFGWDHQFLPSPSGALPPIPPMATAIQNANCRSGPGSLYDVLTSVLSGVELPIVGRNQEGTWWAVQAPGLVAHCWVWGESVEVEGDVEAVPILAAPLLPSPTPVQGCWVYNAQQQQVCTSPCPANAQPGGECTP